MDNLPYHQIQPDNRPLSPTRTRETNNILPLDLDNRPSLAVRGNLTADISHSIYDSISYNTAFIAVSLVKIIISASVLLFAEVECNKPIKYFLIGMLLHDIVYCIVLVMNLMVMLKIQESHRNRRESIMEARMVQGLNQPREFGLLVEENNYYIIGSEESEALHAKRKTITGLGIITNIYFYALWIYGQFVYFQKDSNCSVVAPILNAVVFTYICFAYIYIGIPVIFVVVACLCLPLVLLCLYLFTKKDQIPAKKKIIQNLPVTKYSKSLPGNTDCSICMIDYHDDDNIIQLKCSPVHYFHEDCLKKWLAINGLCPICRKRIDEDNGRNDQEVELRSR